MYFRIIDDAGYPLSTAYNAQSERSAKNAILSLIAPEVCDDDLKDYTQSSLADICSMRGWHLEKQDEPFPGEEYDCECEINWEWDGHIN